MPSNSNVSDEVRQFVFECIDSVEQLEILLLLTSNRTKEWSAQETSKELRSSENSVEKRLESLCAMGFVTKSSTDPYRYHYNPKTERIENVIAELAIVYKEKRHRVLELIFSPMKKARAFANAFRVSNSEKCGDENG